MTWSQTLVATWIQFVLSAGLLLLAIRLGLRWVVQPVERIRVIQWALAVAIAAPALMWLAPLPMLRLGIISPAQPEVSRNAGTTAIAAETTTTSQSEQSSRIVAITSGGDQEELPADIAPAAATSPDILVKSEMGTTGSATTSTSVAAASTDGWTIAARALIVLHVVALLWFLIECLMGLSALRRLYRSAFGSTLDLEVAWNSLPGACGRDVELLISPAIDAPLTFGWRRPVVVVPQTLADAGGPPLQFCLAHEWSHIERSDLVTWRLAQCGQLLLWWHPAFWALRRELRLAQDMLADDRAATIGQGSLEYSELLVDLARQRMPAQYALALTFLDHPSQLMRRVRMLLQRPVSLRSHCTWRFSLVTALIAIGGLLLAGGVRVDATPPETEKLELAAADAKPAEPSNEKSDASKPVEKEGAKPVPAAEKPAEELHYTGIIVDKYTKKGIPGATVVVRRSNYTPQKTDVIEESKHTTDADGKYSFVIPPAQTAIGALYIELDVEHPDYSDRKRFGYALGMIRKNETLGERPFFENVELWPAEPITGTVLAPDGIPLAGVKLQGYSRSGDGDFREYGSFTQATTGEDGKFRLNLIKGGIGVFWVIPDEFAVTSKPVGKDRGDVGTIRLQPGVRVSGTVLSADGKPIAGMPINIDYQSGGTEDVNGLPVATSTTRAATTDARGAFAFAPLPDGQYRLHIDEYARNKTPKVDAVFVASTVTLKEGSPLAPVKVQAVPHVIINAQIYNSKGEKMGGHEFFLNGQFDGQWWHGIGTPNGEGTISMKVPHGLEGVSLQLMTNEHGALRFRRGKGKELENRTSYNIDLGTLNDDIEGFEIIRYKAPIVMISAIDEDGQPVKDFKVAGTYPWGKQQYTLEGEMRSDVYFEHQQDGRYRTNQLVPDEKVTFTVSAKGFEPASEELSLPEGENKDLVITMKKSPEKSE